MDEPEYVRIKFKDIPQGFVDEYNLIEYVHNGWVYFEIVKGHPEQCLSLTPLINCTDPEANGDIRPNSNLASAKLAAF